MKTLNDYVSGTFEFPPLPAHLNADVSTWSSADRESRYGALHDQPIGKTTRMIEEESGNSAIFLASNEPSAIGAETGMLNYLRGGGLCSFTEAVLFEPPEKTLWKGLRIEYAFCTNSCTTCVYAGEAAKTRFEQVIPNRKVKVITNANHFVSCKITLICYG
jgi:hypothetical protein